MTIQTDSRKKAVENKKVTKRLSKELPTGERALKIEEGENVLIVAQDVAAFLNVKPTPDQLIATINYNTNPKQLRLLLESMREEAEEDMRQLRLEREEAARKAAHRRSPLRFIKKLFRLF